MPKTPDRRRPGSSRRTGDNTVREASSERNPRRSAQQSRTEEKRPRRGSDNSKPSGRESRGRRQEVEENNTRPRGARTQIRTSGSGMTYVILSAIPLLITGIVLIFVFSGGEPEGSKWGNKRKATTPKLDAEFERLSPIAEEIIRTGNSDRKEEIRDQLGELLNKYDEVMSDKVGVTQDGKKAEREDIDPGLVKRRDKVSQLLRRLIFSK